MSELNFLFNTDKLFTDQFIPSLEKELNNVVFSSSDLLVYIENNLEVMISKIGTVSISAQLNEIKELKSRLSAIIKEYEKLSNIDNHFDKDSNVKVIVPKALTNEVTKELGGLHYKIKVTNVNDFDTVSFKQ